MEELKLVEYRVFYALQRGDTLCYCPETGEPCSSKCVFFDLFETKFEAKELRKVILSCRSTQLHFVVGT